MQIVRLRTEAITFQTPREALKALAKACKDADLSEYREFRVRPFEHGWQAQFLTVHSFIWFVGKTAPCGYSEPESAWRDPDTGKHRLARCEGGGRLVVRGTGDDSVTDGSMFISARRCPKCGEL